MDADIEIESTPKRSFSTSVSKTFANFRDHIINIGITSHTSKHDPKNIFLTVYWSKHQFGINKTDFVKSQL